MHLVRLPFSCVNFQCACWISDLVLCIYVSMCRQSFWICVCPQLIGLLHLCLFIWLTFSVYGISSSTCLVGWSGIKKWRKYVILKFWVLLCGLCFMGNQMYGRFWDLLGFPLSIPKSLNVEKERELASHLDFIVEYMFLLAP